MPLCFCLLVKIYFLHKFLWITVVPLFRRTLVCSIFLHPHTQCSTISSESLHGRHLLSFWPLLMQAFIAIVLSAWSLAASFFLQPLPRFYYQHFLVCCSGIGHAVPYFFTFLFYSWPSTRSVSWFHYIFLHLLCSLWPRCIPDFTVFCQSSLSLFDCCACIILRLRLNGKYDLSTSLRGCRASFAFHCTGFPIPLESIWLFQQCTVRQI